MLVLTRKAKQSIMIGDGIEVTVVEIRGDAVRLAIDAPRQVPVHRKEVYEEISVKTGKLRPCRWKTLLL